MRRFLSVMHKEFRHMARDVWSTAIATVGAAVLLVVLAYTLSMDIRHLPVVVWDGDRSPQSRAYLDAFRNDDFFALRHTALSEGEATEMVVRDRARVAILIPPDFGEKILAGRPVQVQFVIDGSQPTVATQTLAHVTAVSDSFSLGLVRATWKMSGVSGAQGGGVSVGGDELRVRVRYNPGFEQVHGILPGLMAIVLAMPAISTAMSLAREREQGTLEALIATPISRWQLLAGKIIPYIIVGLVDVVLFTLIGVFGFGIPLRGNPFTLLFLSVLFLMANLGIGLLIATAIRSPQAVMVINFVVFIIPPMIISGMFFPRAAMPWWLRMVSFFLPATHYITISRGVFLKGAGFDLLWQSGLILSVIGASLLMASVLRFKKTLG